MQPTLRGTIRQCIAVNMTFASSSQEPTAIKLHCTITKRCQIYLAEFHDHEMLVFVMRYHT